MADGRRSEGLMERKAASRETMRSTGMAPTCGACSFFEPRTGRCHARPPGTMVDNDVIVVSARPHVLPTDAACLDFVDVGDMLGSIRERLGTAGFDDMVEDDGR